MGGRWSKTPRRGEGVNVWCSPVGSQDRMICCLIFRGAESLMNQGTEWEKKGEYNRAIEMYMKITPNMTTDHELVEDAMVKVRVNK